ncbi:unnamed protein product [Soboliphyme baturini]|uniref:Peptidase_M24 domain-containing protein n=1 Tax=Soboliphyme baturini TaxID=241478 RepID=A0A183IHL2_9BILA|nr:unnamed protein product [Soboliphyme baturini]
MGTKGDFSVSGSLQFLWSTFIVVVTYWEHFKKFLVGIFLHFALQKNNANMIVLAALDDIAWLFNLRGSDISFCPVFFAYAMVSDSFISLFVDREKLTTSCKEHLNSSLDYCRVQIFPYDDALKCLRCYVSDNPSWKVWFSPDTSYAFVSSVSDDRRLEKQSPVVTAKAVKNSVELAGMRRAHVSRFHSYAVAHCEFLCWLENEIVTSDSLTEVSAANKFEKLRQEQQDYVSLSFDTISATGPNASVVHYLPQKCPEVRIDGENLYLVDSGAQYKDGTTDVTRTIMFDKATDFQKQCYTRVLKGHIALATLVFPEDTPGFRLDAVARIALWEVGLNYMHGTGHGIGHFLFVHEGNICFQHGPLYLPGYYQDEEFGIRIENAYEIIRVQTENNYRDIGCLSFKPLTLVPIQTKLLVPEMLTTKEVSDCVCFVLFPYELEDHGRTNVLNWLREQTKPIG